VPNVLQKRLAVAKPAIRAARCAVGTITRRRSAPRNRGRVIRQSPSPGRQFAAGKKVDLTVGK
jgi:beta-lactam-binding protein with PASTA domain